MIPNDQWFEPGDKVMEVITDAEVEAAGIEIDHSFPSSTERGVVYCVESFFANDDGNTITLVGVHDGDDDEIVAMYFRKVEEIRRCSAVVQEAKSPQPVFQQ